jgi:formylglycine-generating enzyme required for sulfatase activity
MRYRLTALLLLAPACWGCWSAAAAVPPSAAQQVHEAAAAPTGFVYVPGGAAILGSDDPDAEDSDRPARRVFVRSFYIGRTEVSHAEWQRFRPKHRVPQGYADRPVTNVGFEEALAYCRFVGGRLPTDVEWEKAARGTDGRRYPWGNRFEPERCRLRRERSRPEGLCVVPGFRQGLAPVTGYAAGASPYGALQMAGNAWEWVSDLYEGDPQRRIIRGGAVGYGERAARTYHRAIEGAGVT